MDSSNINKILNINTPPIITVKVELEDQSVSDVSKIDNVTCMVINNNNNDSIKIVNNVKHSEGDQDLKKLDNAIYYIDEVQKTDNTSKYRDTTRNYIGVDYTGKYMDTAQRCKEIGDTIKHTDENLNFKDTDNTKENINTAIETKYFKDIHVDHDYSVKKESFTSIHALNTEDELNHTIMESNIELFHKNNNVEYLKPETNMEMGYCTDSSHEIENSVVYDNFNSNDEPLQIYGLDINNNILKQCSNEIENVKVEKNIDEIDFIEDFNQTTEHNFVINNLHRENHEYLYNNQLDVDQNIHEQFSSCNEIDIKEEKILEMRDVKDYCQEMKTNVIHNLNSKYNRSLNINFYFKQINDINETEVAEQRITNYHVDSTQEKEVNNYTNSVNNNLNWPQINLQNLNNEKENIKFNELNEINNFDNSILSNNVSNLRTVPINKFDLNSILVKENPDVISISSEDIMNQETNNEYNADTDEYHSSDFEFIDEQDAVKDGLIININPSSRIFSNFTKNVEIKNIAEEFIENRIIYDYSTSLKPNDEMIEHRVPTGDEFNRLFQGHFVPFPMNSIENKAIRPQSSTHMQYEGIGFDMRLSPYADDETDERKKEAKLTANKIHSKYPRENSEPYLQRYYY